MYEDFIRYSKVGINITDIFFYVLCCAQQGLREALTPGSILAVQRLPEMLCGFRPEGQIGFSGALPTNRDFQGV